MPAKEPSVIINELKSIGTFLRRVDASSTPVESAAIPGVAEKFGYKLETRGRDFSILASTPGNSISYERVSGFWFLKTTKGHYVGKGADQLQATLKSK